jgi:tetratricopeptide (TPR) repeat protein
VSAAESRFEARHGGGVTPLVGRQLEMEVLGERWGRAREGAGQVVFLVGEAGIGKSRLADVLSERVAAEPALRLRHQCSPHHGDSALHPVIERLARACGFSSRDAPEVRLGKLESLLSEEEGGGELQLPLLASLLAIPLDSRYAPLNMTPDQQKEATLEVLVEQVIAHAQREPVLLLYEDVHWADATSHELLARLVERIADVAVLLATTSRPDFSPPWLDHAAVTALTLSRIAPPLALDLVDHVASGRTLPEEVRAQIVSRADGVPLFVEELTKAVLESGQLEEQADRYVLSDTLGPVTIPSTLHASLLARLDRLARVREVAQLAAVIGREFSRELLVAVCDLDPVELAGAIERLIDSGLVFRRGAPENVWYVFKHALVRDAAYESLLKSRRREVHDRIAAELEERFPRVVESEPELLAHHFTEAGRAEPAVGYWLAAGRRAAERAAYTEAVAHLTRGLSLVEGLPGSAGRVRAEIELRVALGVPLMKHRTVSSPEVGENYRHARQLTEAIGDDRQRFPVLWGQWYHNMLSFEVRAACKVADELLEIGTTLADESFELEAHHCQWASRFLAGEHAASLQQSDRGVELYRADTHHRLMFIYGGHDPGVCAHDVGALSLWLMGHSEQSQMRMARARELAQDLGQSSTLANCISKSLMLASFLCDLDAITSLGEEILAYTRGEWAEQSRPHALAVLGWVAFERGLDAQGLRQMRDAVASGLFEDPWNVHSVSLVAAALARAGAADEALELIEEAISLSRRNGVAWWLPELLRVRGEALRRRPGDGLEEAQASCWQAFDAARAQGATALQIRAAVSLQRGAAGFPGCDSDSALAADALLSSASRSAVMEAKAAVERLS